ncbi:hypothetical protein BGW36DRAFT_287375 [Talaromyces proteolyticus]|uniref:Azaphilone pigments biosynthesis cluster protein L N-terminal domain-containing protein n=1 Tax=Talaromyces proteolyticus TaxID=1131652 RepID=A0AAD4KYH9_9EURO|nr:uncharacterized protein BGW36DRAFT_287375 [Talaromyces proteolyticus]KAH8703885.1 hypothetical protein BGW36DRAFT_287375 [Talaromyces proteolyticus]
MAAEVIGTASAITTFVTLALEATILLSQTVKSFQSREKLIRELREELQDLQEVLQMLQLLLGNIDVDITVLKRPLERCASACTDFNKLVTQCTQNSSDKRYSKRDWAKLQYMGKDISGFKDMVAGYKSTIAIALAYANLRKTNITETVLAEYKELIENTQCDLESHLQDIRARLETMSLDGSRITKVDAVELQRMEDEKQSTQKSLDICEHFLALMEESRSSLLGDLESAPEKSYQGHFRDIPSQSSLINEEGLSSTHKEFTRWKIQLMQHLFKVDKQLPVTRFDIPLLSDGLSTEQQIFQEEVKGIEDLLEFCKRVGKEAHQPRTNYYEDVTAGDNSRVAVVTTLKDLISVKRIKSGNGSQLALGQMSDDSLQSFFVHPTSPSLSTSK